MEGVFVEEADSGEEVGVQAEGGKKRKVGKGRFGGGSGSARESALFSFLNSYVLCRRMTGTPSIVTWDRMEVTTYPLLRSSSWCSC